VAGWRVDRNLRGVIAAREPAGDGAQHEPDLRREREIGRETHHDAERDAKRGSDGDGSCDGHGLSLCRLRRAAGKRSAPLDQRTGEPGQRA
jgi:hypothetical protein